MAIDFSKYLPSGSTKKPAVKTAGLDFGKYLPAKKESAPIASAAPVAREAGLPDFLGGGRYLTSGPGTLITTPRSQDALPSRGAKDIERDHIFPVALGGVSKKENLQYLPNTREGQQSGKVAVEQQAIDDYRSGKISLPEARLRVATKNQQILGLTPTKEEQTTGGQLKKMAKDAGGKFLGVLKGAGRKISETIKGATPEGVSKSAAQALPFVARTGLSPAALVEEGAKKAIGAVAPAVARAPQRAAVSIAIQPIADILGAKAEFRPTTKTEKLVFGEEPITGVFTDTDEAQGQVRRALSRAGVNPDVATGIAFVVAPLFVGGMKALDLTPIGGEAKAAEKIAAATKIDDIIRLIRPIFKGATDDELKALALPLVEVKDVKLVDDYLRSKGDEIIKGVAAEQQLLKTPSEVGVPRVSETTKALPAPGGTARATIVGEGFTAAEKADPAKLRVSRVTADYQAKLEAFNAKPSPAKLVAVRKAREEVRRLGSGAGEGREGLSQASRPVVSVSERAAAPKALDGVSVKTASQVGETAPSAAKAETKSFKFYDRVKETLSRDFADSPEYKVLTHEKDAERAIGLIEKDSSRAMRIAKGLENAPKEQTDTAITIALAHKAAEEGNVKLQTDLIRSLSLRRTKSGQEIEALKGLNGVSPESYMRKLIQTRLDGLRVSEVSAKGLVSEGRVAKGLPKRIVNERENIKTIIKRKSFDIKAAQEFIDSLACPT